MNLISQLLGSTEVPSKYVPEPESEPDEVATCDPEPESEVNLKKAY